MAADTFLEFQGGNSFKGESQDDKYKDQIEIMSYALGVSNSGSGAVGGVRSAACGRRRAAGIGTVAKAYAFRHPGTATGDR